MNIAKRSLEGMVKMVDWGIILAHFAMAADIAYPLISGDPTIHETVGVPINANIEYFAWLGTAPYAWGILIYKQYFK